jgi:serine carboxypeptidase-like clade 2
LKSTIESLDVCIDDELVAYMNLPTVQKAFHANVTGLPYPWDYCNDGYIS